jgi:hypothetical protein
MLIKRINKRRIAASLKKLISKRKITTLRYYKGAIDRDINLDTIRKRSLLCQWRNSRSRLLGLD